MPGETPFLIVHTTLPDEASARDLLRFIVAQRLAACGHMHKIASSYWWDGRVQDGEEWLVSFKTMESAYHTLEKSVVEKHPYDTPMIVATPVEALNAPYADWLRKETR